MAAEAEGRHDDAVINPNPAPTASEVVNAPVVTAAPTEAPAPKEQTLEGIWLPTDPTVAAEGIQGPNMVTEMPSILFQNGRMYMGLGNNASDIYDDACLQNGYIPNFDGFPFTYSNGEITVETLGNGPAQTWTIDASLTIYTSMSTFYPADGAAIVDKGVNNMHERFCTLCGGRMSETARFCARCGATASARKKTFLNSPGFLISGGTILFAIVLFSGARLYAALQSGAFPREGFYLSAGIVVVVTALAFAFGRFFAARAAGFTDARYRRALRESRASGARKGRAIARPILLAVCLCTLAAAGAALLIKPAADPNAAANGALAANAETGAASDTAAGEQSAATPYVNNSKVKINGIWTFYTDEMSGLNTLQRFVYFDDEKAVCGSCVSPEEVATKLMGGTPLGKVTIDATFNYEVTAASFTDMRGMDLPYVSSAEIALSDPTGAVAPFTAKFDFYQFLDFSNCTAGAPDAYAEKLLGYMETTFTFNPEEVKAIATLPVPAQELYGLWVAQDSMDAFAGFEEHKKNDIPFLFFYIDTMYVGQCSSAASLRDLLMDPGNATSGCTILAQYPMSVESMTYALSEEYASPVVDTCWITVHLDDMAALDVSMDEGSLVNWDGTTYAFTNGVEWSAPYDS